MFFWSFLLYSAIDHFQRRTLPLLLLGMMHLWLFLQYFFKGWMLAVSSVLIVKSKAGLFRHGLSKNTIHGLPVAPFSVFLHYNWIFFPEKWEISIWAQCFAPRRLFLLFYTNEWHLCPQCLILWCSESTQYITFPSCTAARDFLSGPYHFTWEVSASQDAMRSQCPPVVFLFSFS